MSSQNDTLPHDDNIYRITMYPQTPFFISVQCFGMEGVDATLAGDYDSVDELPEWMQRKLAVLNMIKVEPASGMQVDGIGRRIDQYTFWIYRS